MELPLSTLIKVQGCPETSTQVQAASKVAVHALSPKAFV